MADSVKKALVEINTLSRQLLSRISDVQQSLNSSDDNSSDDNSSDEKVTSDKPANINDGELNSLILQRQTLITQLFENNSTKLIQAELPLLNELVTLDAVLSSTSQGCKNFLAQQVIKLKKNHKMANSYQKY
ncbi:MAG: hypothetical protein QF552_03915 [Litorilituus sp.]|nr:hypothetical protein [Litorilituus sp.]